MFKLNPKPTFVGTAVMAVPGGPAEKLRLVFKHKTRDEASAFFQAGAAGYSEAIRKGKFDGVELRILDWKVSPLVVERVSADYFSDLTRFPAGTAEFDNALLMRGLRNEFHALNSFCCMTGKAEEARVAVGAK